MNKKIIIFEEIFPSHKWVIRLYLSRGFAVYYYRINSLTRPKRWLITYLEDGSLIEMDEVYDFLSTTTGYCPDLAYKNIDRVAAYLIQNDGIKRRIVSLYKDEMVYNAFKKNLLGELSRFYYLNIIFHNLNKLFPGERVLFV